MRHWADQWGQEVEVRQPRSKSSSRVRVREGSSKEKVFGVYCQMREREHLARELPLTWRKPEYQ